MKNSALLLLLFAFLCFLPDSILAYKCAPASTTAEFARVDVVLSGEVVAQESREAELEMAAGQKKAKVLVTATELKVKTLWKGNGEKTVFLIDYQYIDKKDARYLLRRNFLFTTNQNYLIYAYNFQNALQTDARCSRTKSLEQAADDIKELGKGNTPTKVVDKTLSEVLTEFIDKWNN